VILRTCLKNPQLSCFNSYPWHDYFSNSILTSNCGSESVSFRKCALSTLGLYFTDTQGNSWKGDTWLNYCRKCLMVAVFFFSLKSIYVINMCLQHRRRQLAPLLSETVDLHNTPNKILNTKFSKGYQIWNNALRKCSYENIWKLVYMT
jgi:hypothetical protein